jgi:PPOX class probable F420-dependent enzyme
MSLLGLSTPRVRFAAAPLGTSRQGQPTKGDAMADRIDGRARELIEARNFCHVATISRDGTPHLAVVWVDTDGEEVLLNSADGRAWPGNLRRDPRTRLTIVNSENPYEYVSVKGRASEITPEGADEHIDALAKKYLDEDEYPFRQPGEVRLIVRIAPEKVALRGG